MNLPPQLLRRCHTTLFKCSEFNSSSSLESVFVTSELGIYRSSLPRSGDKKDRVIRTTNYLLQERLGDNTPVFLEFILELRDRRHARNALYRELEQLYLAVNRALSIDPSASSAAHDPNVMAAAAWPQATSQYTEPGPAFEQPQVVWEQPVAQPPGVAPAAETPLDRIRRQVMQWWDEQSRHGIVMQATQWWNAQDRRTTTIAVIIPVALLCILCSVITLNLVGWMNRSAEPEPSPTPAAQPTSVSILPSTPTAAAILTPTLALSPTPTATAISTVTLPPADPPSDIVYYDVADMNQLVENPPVGIDIRSASVADDMRVNLQLAAEDIPAQLSSCAVLTDSEALLWIESYDPIVPETLASDFYWLFVLDLDGDVDTGRPSGTTAINPDLGYEAAVYVEYSNYEFSSYFLIWDAANAGFSPLISEGVRDCLSESGTFIGIVLPLNVLGQKVEELAQVTPNFDAVKGRAAAETYVDGVRRVIDFYPNLPGQFD